MGNAYEIYALRYATMSPRTPHLNFLIPDPHETTAQDLDYFVWLIRGGGRDILVDTGFNAEEAKARSRKLTLNPVDALANFGVAADTIRDVIVTHLHYDHAGNLDRFPNARFHLQDREMSYATGRCMCNGMLRHPFSVEHVTTMVRHVYGERVTFHSGDGEVAPVAVRPCSRLPYSRSRRRTPSARRSVARRPSTTTSVMLRSSTAPMPPSS